MGVRAVGEEQKVQADKDGTPHKGRGGARPGAGRKAKWGEKTVVMRVPASMREAVEEFLSLKAQGIELVRADEVAARVEAAAQAAAQPGHLAFEEQPTPVEPEAPTAPAKPKKPRAPRKKKAQDTGIDPSRQGSLFDLL